MQYQILRTNITRNAQESLRRITITIIYIKFVCGDDKRMLIKQRQCMLETIFIQLQLKLPNSNSQGKL